MTAIARSSLWRRDKHALTPAMTLTESSQCPRGNEALRRVCAPTLATALLIGTIGTALAHTTIVGTGSGAQTTLPGTGAKPIFGTRTGAAAGAMPKATTGAFPEPFGGRAGIYGFFLE
jgi:hypothetical protein